MPRDIRDIGQPIWPDGHIGPGEGRIGGTHLHVDRSRRRHKTHRRKCDRTYRVVTDDDVRRQGFV
jgi:hypothetical protein